MWRYMKSLGLSLWGGGGVVCQGGDSEGGKITLYCMMREPRAVEDSDAGKADPTEVP